MTRRVRVVTALLAALLLLPGVAQASNDPYRSQQWALDDIRIDEAWEVSRGEGAIVAVIDTGVDLEHPDLSNRILRDTEGEVIGLDLVDDDPTDQHGHGTLVAGIIAATSDNGEGIAGVAPRARVMPIRVLDEAGAGTARDVGTAIRWAVDNGADVVNLSLESLRDDEGRSVGPGAPSDAVEYAWDNGVVVVVASGNNGAELSAYPDDTPAVVVGASAENGEPAEFSDNGGAAAVLAPGVDIISTWCRDGTGGGCDGGTHTYGIAEGTSFAAPHVAGLAALLSAEGYDAEEIVQRIRASAVRSGDTNRNGRIDAAAALGVDGELEAMSARTEMDEVAAADESDEREVRTEPEPATPLPPPDPRPAPEPEPPPAPEPPPEPEPEPEPVDDPEPQPEADPEPVPDPEPEPRSEAAEPVALTHPDDGIEHDVWLRLVAAALVGASLAAWSAAARRTL